MNKMFKQQNKKIPRLRFPEFSGEWEEKRLGEVGDVIGGGTPDTNKLKYWDGKINWFTPTEIKEKYISESKRKITELGLKKSSAKLLPKGTLLLTSRATIGDVSIAKFQCSTNQGFQSIVVNDKNDNEFIYYWILNNKNEFIRRANGSTFLEISAKEIGKIKIPLPALREQQKIADFLSAVDERIGVLQKKRETLEKYKKGIMQKIFPASAKATAGRPAKGEKVPEIRFKPARNATHSVAGGDDNGKDFPEWEEKRLGEIFEYKNGKTFEQDIVENGKYYLITLNSITIDGKLKGEHKRVNVNDNSLEEGDLVIVLSDVAHGNFLGLTAIIPDNNFVLNQRMGALKPKTNINVYYVSKFINYHQKYFKKRGQGTSQKNLSKADVLKFPLKLPSLPEQQKIANFLSAIDKKIELVDAQIQKMQEWKRGLMQGLFV